MGVRTLVGQADGSTHAAVMYDSVSGWTVGPVFEGEDAEEKIEAFLGWLRTMAYIDLVGEIGFEPADLPVANDGTDPRHWRDRALEKLVVYWRREYVEDGRLKREAVG